MHVSLCSRRVKQPTDAIDHFIFFYLSKSLIITFIIICNLQHNAFNQNDILGSSYVRLLWLWITVAMRLSVCACRIVVILCTYICRESESVLHIYYATCEVPHASWHRVVLVAIRVYDVYVYILCYMLYLIPVFRRKALLNLAV